MSKTIIRNLDEYNTFVADHTNRDRSKGPFTDVQVGGPPDSYPALLIYEFRYSNVGADYYDGDYVYPSDFEDNTLAQIKDAIILAASHMDSFAAEKRLVVSDGRSRNQC